MPPPPSPAAFKSTTRGAMIAPRQWARWASDPALLVVAVDWSAASTRGPTRPAADRCWLAAGGGPDRGGVGPPEYFRTRADCRARLLDLLRRHHGPALVGFDFPFGYPARTPLPRGRALARLLSRMIQDDASGRNNRFEVAAALNARVRSRGRGPGPFWGRPQSCPAALPSTRPPQGQNGVPEFRAVERLLRERGWRVQSAFKCYTTGSVGSQALLGLATVDSLARALGDRGLLWPFDPGPLPERAVVLAEIWPSLTEARRSGGPDGRVRDAAQVESACRWLLEDPDRLGAALAWGASAPAARREGWILGVTDAFPPDGRRRGTIPRS